MRGYLMACAACLAMVLAACSDEDPDTIKTKCEQTCEAELKQAPACGSLKTECINKCRKLGQDAENNPETMENSGCGECIAALFTYSQKDTAPCTKTSTDPTCCYGVVQPTSLKDPRCLDKCYEPDGGVGY